jgi:hypothetical protein
MGGGFNARMPCLALKAIVTLDLEPLLVIILQQSSAALDVSSTVARLNESRWYSVHCFSAFVGSASFAAYSCIFH